MEKIKDLSFNNLVNIIQGNEIKAGDTLTLLAEEMEFVKTKITEYEKQLNYFKGRKEALITASSLVVKHINRELPLAVKRQDFIIVVSDKNISIEKNVI